MDDTPVENIKISVKKEKPSFFYKNFFGSLRSTAESPYSESSLLPITASPLALMWPDGRLFLLVIFFTE